MNQNKTKPKLKKYIQHKPGGNFWDASQETFGQIKNSLFWDASQETFRQIKNL